MASNVEDARQAFLDALEEAGMDRATAEAQTKYIMPSEPTVVGNYADLQRMGAAVLTGEIPTGPTRDDVESSDLSEAFTMPPDPATREALDNEGGAASLETPTSPETQAGQGTPPDESEAEAEVGAEAEGEVEAEAEGGDLSTMTKAELLDEADARGVDVSESWTKADIIAAIEEG